MNSKGSIGLWALFWILCAIVGFIVILQWLIPGGN